MRGSLIAWPIRIAWFTKVSARVNAGSGFGSSEYGFVGLSGGRSSPSRLGVPGRGGSGDPGKRLGPSGPGG